MTGVETHRDALAAFLDRQYRQVWAVHRQTGERVFIDWGEATPEMREHAKANLRCPVPGCDLRISARGRTKRDHFFHLGRPGHGEGEGEWHLQAKALLTEWANAQPGVTAREEETVHVPGREQVRRADVMATWVTGGAKVALEVEYKDYKPEHWTAKQADYDTAGVGCTWVFGHLPRYLRQPRKPADLPAGTVWDRLQWVELTAAVARADRPIVFINPVERAIVTAIQRQEPLERAERERGWWRCADRVGTRLAHPDCHVEPVLVLDVLDDCHLDPDRGLITPTMALVAEERQRIHQRAVAAKAVEDALAAAAFKRRQAEQAERERDAQDREARRAFAQQKAAEDARKWEQSPLRQHLTDRYGGRLPSFLTCHLDRDRGVYAHPAHWHSQLFNDLVLGHGHTPMIGRTVNMRQVYAMLCQHFRLSPQASLRAQAITGYLQHLRINGILQFDTGPNGTIGDITVTSDGQQRPPKPAPPPTSTRSESSAGNKPREVAPASQPTTHPSTGTWASRTQRWEESMLHRTVLGMFRGVIPTFLADDLTPGDTETIDALPVHWHSYLYLKYVHGRGQGYSFTLADAINTLAQHGLIAETGEAQQHAVRAYLEALSSDYGFLTQPPPSEHEQRYYLDRRRYPDPTLHRANGRCQGG